jgi:hypothetical protein
MDSSDTSFFSGEASWYIAVGVFAIAAQISRVADKNK